MYRGALLCSVVCVRNSHSRVRVLYSLFRFQCSSKQFLSFHAFYRGIHDQSNFKQASLSMKIIFASINSRFFSSLSFPREFFLILYPGNLFLNPKMTFGFCFKMMVWVWGVSYTAYLMQDYLQLDLSISGLSMNLSNSIGCYPRQVFPLFRCPRVFIYNQAIFAQKRPIDTISFDNFRCVAC